MDKTERPSELEKLFGRLRAGVYEFAGLRVRRQIIEADELNEVAAGSFRTFRTEGEGDCVLEIEEGQTEPVAKVIKRGQVRVAIVD